MLRRTHTVLIIAFLSFSVGFLVGAIFHKEKIWPFGQGFYKSIISQQKELSKKSSKLGWRAEKVFSQIHIFNHYKYEKGFNHIALIDQKGDTFNLIGVRGNKKINFKNFSEALTPLKVFKVTANINPSKNSYKEELIYQNNNNLRVTDVLFSKQGEIYISHISTNKNNQIALRVIKLIKGKNILEERLVYSSEYLDPPHGIHQTGGKMVQFNQNKILLALGDFQKSYLINEPSSPFGKTILIDIDGQNTDPETFSIGHRNIQGLTISSTGKIFATEHGPQGGDEINLLEKGKNYGWPDETYGIPYGLEEKVEFEIFSNFGGAKYGTHDKTTKPIYAFIPSNGIKAIEQQPSEANEFPSWKNNYFICSLHGTFRMEIAEMNTRVIFTEKLAPISCRDMQISSSGVIILSSERGLEIIKRYREQRG